MVDALRLIEERRQDAVVVPTMTAGRGWPKITGNESLDLSVSGAMGQASSVALGICLARPDKRVILVDGDGSLLMNLGTLVTVGGQSPENLYHFVLDNGCYFITGGQPVPNAGNVNFVTLARGTGYASAFGFEDLEEFATSVDELMNATGAVLVSLKTEPEIENTPLLRPRRTPEAIKDVKQALAR